MQPYRRKRKFRKSGEYTSSKYLNKESPENKKPRSVLQLLEQSKVSAVRPRIQANMATGSIKVEKDVPKDISKMLTEILEKIAPIETISSNLEKPTDQFQSLNSKVSRHTDKLVELEQKVESTNIELETIKGKISEHPKCGDGALENDLLKLKIEKLEDMHKKQESFLRQDNIIFEGITETENESCAELVYDILINNLEIPDARSTIKFLRIHRVGHKQKSLSYSKAASNDYQKPRPIIAKCMLSEDKHHIMSCKHLLANSGHKIWINHDYPECMKQSRRVL